MRSRQLLLFVGGVVRSASFETPQTGAPQDEDFCGFQSLEFLILRSPSCLGRLEGRTMLTQSSPARGEDLNPYFAALVASVYSSERAS
jgi:hypothetical protein